MQHLGKTENHRDIILTLAKFGRGLTRKQIVDEHSQFTGGNLTRALFDLEAAGFISSTPPFNKGHDSKHKKYFLTDHYLKFYYRFILPNKKQIISRKKNLFRQIFSTSAFNSYLGECFELLCYKHAHRIAEILGFSGINYQFGPFYKHGKFQIDLLFDRADNVIVLCEIKYQKKHTLPKLHLLMWSFLLSLMPVTRN